MKTTTCLLLGLLLAGTVSFATIPLNIVETIGGDEGEVFLHQPIWLNYAPDGTLYMLNSGDCQVLHMSSDWELIESFGRCGEGPGEFSNPTGMVLYKEQVWVFELARITVYELDGTYTRTIVTGNQYGATVVLDDRMITRLGAGDRTVAWLDDEGEIVETFGLECPTDFFEGFKQCRNMQILPHDEGRCLLLNMVDGQAVLIGEDGYPAWDRQLINKEDDSQMSTSDDGESVSMSLSLGLGMGLRDSHGRYWINKLPATEEDATVLTIMDADLKHVLAEFELPDGVFTWQIAESPDGRILLVSTNESTIYVCDLDESGLEI